MNASLAPPKTECPFNIVDLFLGLCFSPRDQRFFYNLVYYNYVSDIHFYVRYIYKKKIIHQMDQNPFT